MDNRDLKNRVIDLAIKAGFYVSPEARKYQPNCIVHTHHMIDEELLCFYVLAYNDGLEAAETSKE